MWFKRIVYTACIIVFLLIVIQPSRDPDLGWHLRYGQYFFQTGHVLRDNIISYVWPQYKWVQASWFYDLFVYQLFTHFGFLGLSIGAGLTTLLVFLLITWPQKRLRLPHLITLGIIFIALVGPIWGGGMRTQTPSTLFLAIVFLMSDWIINPEERKNHTWFLWILPIIFFVWANFHGGFALGLILLSGEWLVYGLLKIAGKVQASHFKAFGISLAASWITPLINPWGIRIYEETFKHTSNVNLLGISEWAPLINTPYEAVITGIFVLITTIILVINKKTKSLPILAVLLVTTYLAYSATRFVVVLAVFITYHLARELPKIKTGHVWNHAAEWVITIVLSSLVILDMLTLHTNFSLPDTTVLTFDWNGFCQVTWYCSEQLTERMRKDPPKGNGFHPYNYGGYLSWRVPMVKTFIDGRMAAWEEDGKTPPILQGDWIAMPNGPVAFIKYNAQYHFQWVISPTPSDITKYLDDLVKSGKWQKKYSDDRYSYFVKL